MISAACGAWQLSNGENCHMWCPGCLYWDPAQPCDCPCHKKEAK